MINTNPVFKTQICFLFKMKFVFCEINLFFVKLICVLIKFTKTKFVFWLLKFVFCKKQICFLPKHKFQRSKPGFAMKLVKFQNTNFNFKEKQICFLNP